MGRSRCVVASNYYVTSLAFMVRVVSLSVLRRSSAGCCRVCSLRVVRLCFCGSLVFVRRLIELSRPCVVRLLFSVLIMAG